MIPIGNQTSFTAAGATAPFEYALASGFDAFEWFPDKKPGAGWDEGDLPEELRESIRREAQARGMRLSVHARWQANPLDPESYSLLYADLNLARGIGAALLNVHLFEEAGLAAFVSAIIPLAQSTADAGISLAIENTPAHSPELFNELFVRLRSTNSAPMNHVGMCLDLGHANLCAATRNNYIAFVDRLGPDVPIIHVHLHENWGDADTHLPLFTGPSARDDAGVRAFLDRLKRRGFSGSIILEQWPEPPSLLNQARDRLRDLLGYQRACLSEKVVGKAAVFATKAEMPTGSSRFARRPGSGEALGCGPATQTTGTDLATRLVDGDQRARSWREKLEALLGLLSDERPPLTDEALVDLAIYLHWLQTGHIRCEEDGRHMRPGHHARIALNLRERLVERTTPEQAKLLRLIWPWLPSSAQTFRTAEPLTRIRDIAHRNDIPSELKQELKHSLQNKLHRCAGPEDLETCERLWRRISAPGATYAPAFVEQFRLFREELKEFFNARSLEERLRSLLPHVDVHQAQDIDLFFERPPNSALRQKADLFNALTRLRTVFSAAAGQAAAEQSHAFLMADIGLEDFAFVLLSDLINELSATELTDWSTWLEVLGLAARNLFLSRIQPRECGAVFSEVQAWDAKLDPTNREQMLRLKASVARARRLADDYCDRFLSLFSARAHLLGPAFGVDKRAVRDVIEGGIRAHLVFQLSKLASDLLRRVRMHLSLPGWDVLVTGTAVGRLQTMDDLGKERPDSSDPAIFLLGHADGDEEIPTGVVGIILAHEMPHLSHFGVRARQAGLVLACCEEAVEFEELRALEGHVVFLNANSEYVTCSITDKTAPPWLTRKAVQLSTPPAPEENWLSLQKSLPERAGGKAGGARRLEELARLPGAVFDTPPGLAIPLGVMEKCIHRQPGLAHEYQQALRALNNAPDEKMAEIARSVQRLIERVEVPEEVLSKVRTEFQANERLIVRSSANCEDLEKLSGAGLYDSVSNVAPADVGEAVHQVWASLWAPRALLSRREAGLANESVQMGVLIQKMLAPELAFVLHSIHPLEDRPHEAYAELVVGLGETLVSGVERGNPYRLVCDKRSGEVTLLAFANFSTSLVLSPEGGLDRETMDYSKIRFSIDAEYRKEIGRRLGAIAALVETALGSAQDIEGGIVSDKIYLFQARPQQGGRAGSQ
jgi:phosphoglucan,water dikinase